MLVILVVIATLLAVWRYTLWYRLSISIAVYGMAAVTIAATVYSVEDTCNGPALPVALAGTTGFVVAATYNMVPVSSHMVLILAVLGTTAFSPSTYCTVLYASLAALAVGACVYCIKGGVNLRNN